MVGDQAAVVGVHLVGADAHALAHADAGRHAVDAGAVRRPRRALDDGAGGLHALERLGGDLDALAAAGDAHDLVEREPLAVQDHAHREPVCRAPLGAGRGRGRNDDRIDQSPGPPRGVRWAAMVSALLEARRAVIGPPGWRFFSFWLALAITNLGTWAGVVALQLQMLDLTGDQAYVSAVVVAEYLPAVILGTVLGHLLDRVPPRNGLAACELLAAAAWALMVDDGPRRDDRRARADLRRDDGHLQDRLDGGRAASRRRRPAGGGQRRDPDTADAHEHRRRRARRNARRRSPRPTTSCC